MEDLIAEVDSEKSSIDHGMIEGFVLYSQDGQTSYKCVCVAVIPAEIPRVSRFVVLKRDCRSSCVIVPRSARHGAMMLHRIC